ncbi:MAG: M20/M25/M40 family metallo-hydrolase [Oscillospiraceae bacterium]
MDIIDALKDLCLARGISGHEGEVARVFKSHIEPYSDSLKTDKAGNVICKIAGTKRSSRKVMIFAHLDTLGMIVRKIDTSGLIQVDRLGGLPEKALPGLHVTISKFDGGYLDGVIGVKSLHATSDDEKYKTAKVTELLIDIGAKSREEVLAAGVRIGCPVIYQPSFSRLLGNTICGTALDNRGGCASLIAIAKALHDDRPDSDIYIVATVWEEFSIRGAIFAARAIKPDFAICLDISLAGDTPDTSGMFETTLGGGPTISLYNFHGRGTLNGTIAHRGLYLLALRCAQENNIPVQEFAALGILTDAAYVQLENDYIACIDIGFPARYAHSPVECCDLSDIERMSELVIAMARNINDSLSSSRY